jgi:hypothetical protein
VLREHIRENPFLKNYYGDIFDLEIQVLTLRNHINATGRLPGNLVKYYKAAAFIIMIDRVYRRLSVLGRKNLKGRMLDGLRSQPYGLMPLAAEIDVATHLMSLGFDVTFFDLEGGGGFDFLSTRNSCEIEVDVKWMSGDIGRKVHRRRLYELSSMLYPVAKQTLEISRDGHLVRIAVPNRLNGNSLDLLSIKNAVEKVINSDLDRSECATCVVSHQKFDITTSPFADMACNLSSGTEIQQWMEKEMHVTDSNALVLGRPGRSAFIAVIESLSPDRVLRGIMHQLERSAETQFTKQRPAFLFAKLADLSEEELLNLAQSESKDPSD